MIPILYEKTETAFTSNGLGRLRDMIECRVSEERNSIYEAEFRYPVTGANFDQIKVGRIIGVTHDESGDIQPFDIVSYSRPIDGVVTFHAVHISYRQSYMTATGSNINSLEDAFTMLKTAEPDNPFSYETDKLSVGYMAGADGKPKTVRSLLGGVEGSILDTYGGEYEWDAFRVILHKNRGVERPFTIRYGVNLLEYNEDLDITGTYSSCIPYWTDGNETVIGDRQVLQNPTTTGRGECVPLDVSDKFESKPTKAEVEAAGLSLLTSSRPYAPTQNIKVKFARLQEYGELGNYAELYRCRLCDSIEVIFPSYDASGMFKIVKTVWNVLADRYDEMELGDLSITLAQALGSGGGSMRSGSGGGEAAAAYVVETGLSGNWRWRKWNDGTAECWGTFNRTATSWSGWGSLYYANPYNVQETYPSGLFTAAPAVTAQLSASSQDMFLTESNIAGSAQKTPAYYATRGSGGAANATYSISYHAIGRWQ